MACSQSEAGGKQHLPNRTERPTATLTVNATPTPKPTPTPEPQCPNSTERGYFDQLSGHMQEIGSGNEIIMGLSQEAMDESLLFSSPRWVLEVAGGFARMNAGADSLSHLNPRSSSLSNVDRLAKQVSADILLAVDYLAQLYDSQNERDIERMRKQWDKAASSTDRMNKAIATFCD